MNPLFGWKAIVLLRSQDQERQMAWLGRAGDTAALCLGMPARVILTAV
jgi:hypothetical protein